MKYLIILADGFADEPIKEYQGKTPIMIADTPNIDSLCKLSKTGLLKTVPDSLHPGSEVANMSVLGYDPEIYYRGRGVLEATAMGITIEEEDLVFRCNLVHVNDDALVNHSAGHISTEESKQLIEVLNNELGNEFVKFYPGVSYRHVLVLKGFKQIINCTPPHDIPGKAYAEFFPKSDTDKNSEDMIRKLMISSKKILEKHTVNKQRSQAGKSTANMIWPWSGGHLPALPSFSSLTGIRRGAVISAVDLIHGLGKIIGLKSIYVKGATGLFDTNYTGKVEAALKALDDHDLVYLHIEAADEAGHEGNIELKVKIMEDIDELVVKRVLTRLSEKSDIAVSFLPDHPTPCKLRTHTRNPVPFMMYKPEIIPDKVTELNEFSVIHGGFGLLKGNEFISEFLKK